MLLTPWLCLLSKPQSSIWRSTVWLVAAFMGALSMNVGYMCGGLTGGHVLNTWDHTVTGAKPRCVLNAVQIAVAACASIKLELSNTW